MNSILKKALFVLVLSSLIKWLNQSFFFGFVIGVLVVVITQYILIIQYVQRKQGGQITLGHVVQVFETVLHPIKKNKQYVNKFSQDLKIEEKVKPAIVRKSSDIETTVHKVGRKKYSKKIDVYTSLVESIRDAEQTHGTQLQELDAKYRQRSELDLQITHKYQGQDMEIIEELSGWHFQDEVDSLLLLPTWKEYRKALKNMGISHVELSKMINSSLNDQLNMLKKDYLKEVDEFRKNRKKLKQQNAECFTHFFKIQGEFNNIEKEANATKAIYNEMLKKREDPTAIIKYEMKVKLITQSEDNIRAKMVDAKERVKEIQHQIGIFNKKLDQFTTKWEEQRLIYLKQGLQNQLIGFEDLAQQVSQQVLSLIVVVDKDFNQLYPTKSNRNASSPKSFTALVQTGEIQELSLQDQYKECSKQTEYLLNQWGQIQKYDEEVELFMKDISQIFAQYTTYFDRDLTNLQKQLETEDQSSQEQVKIIVRSIPQQFIGMKDIYKSLSDRLEKKRQEMGKNRLDLSIGKELEICARKDFQTLQNLYKDEKHLEKYQGDMEVTTKSKMLMQHFFQEVKSNIKDTQSLGKLVQSVGQSANKVQRMSTMSEEQWKVKQTKIIEEQKTLLSLQGYTLNNLQELLNKHNKVISKFKKSFLDDISKLILSLSFHFHQTIDDMTHKLKAIEPKPKKQQIIDKQEQIEQEQSEQLEPIQEDFDTTPVHMISKIVQVLASDWMESEYFKHKICKLLGKTFNKKRTSVLSEIVVKSLQITGEPPQITNLIPQRQELGEFLADLDISFRGKVLLILETKIIINWPKENYAQVPVEIKVGISTFTSRMRLCMVPSYVGKSWISMIGQPVLNLDIEPTLLQKFNIANIPSIGDLMREFLVNKIKLMTYPNKQSIKLPLSKRPISKV